MTPAAQIGAYRGSCRAAASCFASDPSRVHVLVEDYAKNAQNSYIIRKARKRSSR